MNSYWYDAEGRRVARWKQNSGTIGPPNCAIAPNVSTNPTYALDAQYLLGLGGDQVSELNGASAWQHSNLWAGAHLDATYDKLGLHFHLADPLGTRRIQTNVLGQVENSFQSLPFGDGFVLLPTALATADDATENHYTGKERDAESGNDYFEARYYGSTMGRFVSPDWSAKEEPVPYATMGDPQSLNLYAYMRNNPLGGVDADGHGPLEDFISWVAVGVATEGGGGFSRNVGIGALKGIGQAAYTLGSMASNLNNPG